MPEREFMGLHPLDLFCAIALVLLAGCSQKIGDSVQGGCDVGLYEMVENGGACYSLIRLPDGSEVNVELSPVTDALFISGLRLPVEDSITVQVDFCVPGERSASDHFVLVSTNATYVRLSKMIIGACSSHDEKVILSIALELQDEGEAESVLASLAQDAGKAANDTSH